MPVIRPEKANSVPTDLGTKPIAEVNAVYDKLRGPPNKNGTIKPDTFSMLTGEERAEISRKGRELAGDRFVVVRQVAKNMLALNLIHRFFRFIGQTLGLRKASLLSKIIIAVALYNRWGALSRLSKEPLPAGAPRIVPFFGALLTMAAHKDDMHDFLLEVARKTGFATLEIPIPMTCFITLMDPRDREYVLKANPWNYLKNRDEDPACFERVFAEVLGRGIFSTDGSEWFSARKIASHMFSGTALRTQMEHVFNSHADRVVELLRKTAVDTGRVIDIQEVYQSAVFDAFCEIAFGVFPNATAAAIEGTKPEFLVAFDRTQQIASERVMTPPLTWNFSRLLGIFFEIGREGEFAKHIKTVNSYIFRIIDERLNEKDISQKKDLLSLYIQFARSQSQPFTREDYRDIINNFMIAGRDTTSCTLTYATKYLSENPAVLKRLGEEGLFELGSNNRTLSGTRSISWEESKSIPYADAVVNEVLRMAPPVGDDFRICVGDDVLPSGLPVRVGTRVGILNTAIGRDPLLWSNPDKFEPERWMKYDAEGVPQPLRRVDEYVHPIFFAGRRLCLGKDMARFEAIVFMSKLLAEFKLEANVAKDAKYVMGPVIFIDGGLPCKITSRNNK